MTLAQDAASAKSDQKPQTLTIKDPAEYNAYMNAIQMPNSVDKARALERLLAQYPNTVVKSQVLQAELLVYQIVKNEDEAVRTAQRLLEIEPANLRMLSLLAYTYQDCANRHAGNGKSCAESAIRYGHQGLNVISKVKTPPVGMTDEEFNTLKEQTKPIFENAVRLERPAN
jgi:tetratricopeptide (TPR) repeat protein